MFGAPPNPPRSGPSKLLVGLLVWAGCSVLIILVLAAILFPVFAKARERAKQTRCMNSARQIALAIQQYAGSHKDRLPAGATWEDAIAPNLGAGTDVGCPEATTGSGFVLNGSLAGRTTAVISDPHNTVLVFEGGNGRNVVGGPNLAEARHYGRANVAFVDGHVKAIPPSDLNKLRW